MCLCYFRMDNRSVQLERGMRKKFKLTVQGRGPGPGQIAPDADADVGCQSIDLAHPSLSFDASSPSPIVDISHTLGRREGSRVVSKKEYHGAESYVYPELS